MGFGQILFGFSGRINRAKYWLAVLFWTAVWIVALILFVLFIARDFAAIPDPDDMSGPEALRLLLSSGISAILLVIVVIVPMVVSGFAVGIKRLHDRNKSGWWTLLFFVAPSVLQGASSSFDGAVSLILSLAGMVVAIWALVELGFLRGTRGPNQYGPDPLPPGD